MTASCTPHEAARPHPGRRMLVVRLTLDDPRRCRGTAVADSGHQAAFDGWLGFLGAVARLVDDAAAERADRP